MLAITQFVIEMLGMLHNYTLGICTRINKHFFLFSFRQPLMFKILVKCLNYSQNGKYYFEKGGKMQTILHFYVSCPAGYI